MISTEDKLLKYCCPDEINWDEFVRNCSEALNTPEVHSDEISSDDEALANEERDSNKRPENIRNTNSVIKVHDKKWRSTRVCKVAKLFQKYNLYVYK